MYGMNYSPLGSGTRIAGGWELTGVSLPEVENLFVRARALFYAGTYSSVGSMLEAVRVVSIPADAPPVWYVYLPLAVRGP